MSGSDLSERLCAEPAGGRAGGVVYDRASGLSRSRRRRSWRRSAPRSAGRWTVSLPTTRSRWCGSARATARSIVMRPYLASAGARLDGPGWPRSGSRRSFRTCSLRRKQHGQRRGSVVFVHEGRSAGDAASTSTLWDADFGPAFIKVCAYFPYPMKVWVNGHEWAKRQAAKAGIGFTELSNGFATCRGSSRAAGDL